MSKLIVPKQIVIYVSIVIVTAILVKPFYSITYHEDNMDVVPPTCTWTYPDHYIYYFKPRPTRVTPLDYKLIIDMQRKDTCKSNPDTMVILVVTQHIHTKLRNMIRSTWGSIVHKRTSLNETIRVIFLFGQHNDNKFNKAIENEAQVHHDILLFDFRESYYNLTIKVLLGLKWVDENCPQTKYVLKVDDDTYLNIPGILKRLRLSEWNEQICGHYSKSEPVVRRKGDKSRVDYESYPFQYYPPHVKGRTYFMPVSIASKIVNIAEFIPYINIEDVHITGVLAKAVGRIKHKSVSQIEYHPHKPALLQNVVSGRTIISSVNSSNMGLDFWKFFSSRRIFFKTH